ncbi:MAG: hypothetical protein DRQ55_12755, partial [Planctomycetota bacterium]
HDSLAERSRHRWDGPGARIYGAFSPARDRRDLVTELQDEVADQPNYAHAIDAKLSHWRARRLELRLRLALVRLCARVSWWAIGAPGRWPACVRGRMAYVEYEHGWPSDVPPT